MTRRTSTQHAAGKRRREGLGFSEIALAVALAIGLCVGVGVSGAFLREQGEITLKQSVLDAAMQCFAIEGAYPQSLEHLEEEYGLTIDHDSYTVMYEAFASNVPPTVMVVAR